MNLLQSVHAIVSKRIQLWIISRCDVLRSFVAMLWSLFTLWIHVTFASQHFTTSCAWSSNGTKQNTVDVFMYLMNESCICASACACALACIKLWISLIYLFHVWFIFPLAKNKNRKRAYDVLCKRMHASQYGSFSHLPFIQMLHDFILYITVYFVPVLRECCCKSLLFDEMHIKLNQFTHRFSNRNARNILSTFYSM